MANYIGRYLPYLPTYLLCFQSILIPHKISQPGPWKLFCTADETTLDGRYGTGTKVPTYFPTFSRNQLKQINERFTLSWKRKASCLIPCDSWCSWSGSRQTLSTSASTVLPESTRNTFTSVVFSPVLTNDPAGQTSSHSTGKILTI